MDKRPIGPVPRPVAELEYVEKLVEGHAAIFWRSLPQDKPDAAQVPELVKDALYRAIAQVFRERGGVPLPPNRQQFSNILSAARRQLRVVTE